MVKIVEFAEKEDFKLPFDIVDDLHVFMRNDPMFYRKQYFPTMTRISELTQNKKKVNPDKEFTPMIDSAIKEYCSKYDVARDPNEVFSEDDRKALVSKIYSEEIDNIRRGDY
jgi:hypothetical protein